MNRRTNTSSTTSDTSYYIGFDGGGTKIAATVIDDKGTIVCRATGEPGNAAVLGVEKTFEHLVRIVDSLALEVPELLSRAKYMVFGLAGISKAQPELRTELIELANSKWSDAAIEVVNDGYLAWFATNRGGPAIAVISGTGSACIGVDSHKAVIRKGGLGRLVSDQGSGFFIGRAGIRKGIAAAQSLSRPTVLSKLILDEYELDDVEDAPNRIKGHSEIAAFAKRVHEAASQGDAVAGEIIDQAVSDLSNYVQAVWKDGSFDEKILKVGMFGGCLDHMPMLRAKFSDALSQFNPRLRVCEPPIAPDIAAAEIALSMHTQPSALPALDGSI